MYFNVYVIRDNGSEETSMPFFAQNDVVARRQFGSTLRTMPPSCRGDFQLELIGQYDHQVQMLKDAPDCIVICTGADDDMVKMMSADLPFYARGGIDQAPVTNGEVNHE